MDLKSLLFRSGDETPTSATNPVGTDLPGATISVPATASRITRVALATTGSASADLVTELVLKFKEAVKEQNIPGIDFYEFCTALFKDSSNPQAPDYQRTFANLQMAAEYSSPPQTLTSQYLIDTAQKYKDIVDGIVRASITKATERNNEETAAKAKETESLEKDKTQVVTEIDSLEKALNAAKEKKQSIINSLEGIDQKYKPTLDKIANDLAAVRKAGEQVIGNFDEIETGIKNNIK
ncbi:MAG: hypothetical protein LBD11_02555 [Candidatus Peribacteria bacterium]|nr:hypothetical protein [Candidatus Peribacteria bacterium]